MLLASDFQSPYQPLDVNIDLEVSSSDALVVLERLNAGIGPITSAPSGIFPDVTGDGSIAPLDALRVINQLNRDTPVVAARLMNDTAPNGQTNHDRITSDHGIAARLSRSVDRVELRVDDSPPVDVTDRIVDLSFSLSAAEIDALLPAAVADGVRQIEISLPEHGQLIEFTLQIDRAAPVPSLVETDGILRRARKTFEFVINELLSADAPEEANFAIGLADGPSANPPVAVTAVSQEAGRVHLELDQRLVNASYRLAFSDAVGDLAGNVVALDGLEFTVEQLAALAIDPATQLVTVASESRTVSARWDAAVQQAVIATGPGPTIASRAYGMVHTAMYDAWSAYDDLAASTQLGDSLQRPAAENTVANKAEAMSFAAYRVLDDLFATETSRFDQLMLELGYDPNNSSQDVKTPAGIGNAMASALLAFRHVDGANQRGEDAAGEPGVAYSDTTSYAPANQPGSTIILDRWSPELVPLDSDPGMHDRIQQFLTPHWGAVQPFGLSSPDQLRPTPPQPFLLVDGEVDLNAKTITLADGSVVPIDRSAIGTVINPEFIAQAEHVVDVSAGLDDRQKLVAEFWEDGAGTSFPPGTWMSFGQFVSARDGHTLDQDAQMFFALGNAVFDAGVATWEAKSHYDYVRPVRAIRELGRLGLIGEFDETLGGFVIEARTPEGLTKILASDFLTYQTPGSDPSPPFPEYTSGHSSFSAAGAAILRLFTGSDEFGGQVRFQPGESRFEPGAVPSQPVTLDWDTFSAAADEAGISRLYGGIHFSEGDLNGRQLGQQVGQAAWDRAQFFIQGGI